MYELINDDSVRTVIASVLRRADMDPQRATIVLSGMDEPSGSPAEVRLQYPVNLMVMGLVGRSDLSSFSLSASAVMRNE